MLLPSRERLRAEVHEWSRLVLALLKRRGSTESLLFLCAVATVGILGWGSALSGSTPMMLLFQLLLSGPLISRLVHNAAPEGSPDVSVRVAPSIVAGVLLSALILRLGWPGYPAWRPHDAQAAAVTLVCVLVAGATAWVGARRLRHSRPARTAAVATGLALMATVCGYVAPSDTTGHCLPKRAHHWSHQGNLFSQSTWAAGLAADQDEAVAVADCLEAEELDGWVWSSETDTIEGWPPDLPWWRTRAPHRVWRRQQSSAVRDCAVVVEYRDGWLQVARLCEAADGGITVE